jgi:hypothetical protein
MCMMKLLYSGYRGGPSGLRSARVVNQSSEHPPLGAREACAPTKWALYNGLRIYICRDGGMVD